MVHRFSKVFPSSVNLQWEGWIQFAPTTYRTGGEVYSSRSEHLPEGLMCLCVTIAVSEWWSLKAVQSWSGNRYMQMWERVCVWWSVSNILKTIIFYQAKCLVVSEFKCKSWPLHWLDTLCLDCSCMDWPLKEPRGFMLLGYSTKVTLENWNIPGWEGVFLFHMVFRVYGLSPHITVSVT